MREGVILCEDSPDNIMNNHNCESMEQAFLALCSIQETFSSNNFKGNRNTIEEQRDVAKKSLNILPTFSVDCFKAEVFKNTVFVWRNKPMLNFLFLLPAFLAASFNYTIGCEPSNLNVGLVNGELINGIESCFESTMQEVCDLETPLSCRIINKLKENKFNLIEIPSVEDGKKYFIKRHLWAIISIPQNYSKHLINRLELNLRTDDDSVERGQINIWLDFSNYFVGIYFKIKTYKGFMEALNSFLHDCRWPLETFAIPIKVKESFYGNTIPDMTHFFGPPIVILLVFFFPMSYTIGVLLQEKADGVLDRSMVLGLNLTEVLFGHTVVQTVIMVVQIIIIGTIIYIGYGHPFFGNSFSVVALLLFQGICGMTFGFFLALLCTNILLATLVSFGTLSIYIVMAGLLWPAEGIYYVLRWFQPVVPLYYSTEALRSLTIRGWPISHPTVYNGFISLFVWSILYVLLAHTVKHLNIQMPFFAKK